MGQSKLKPTKSFTDRQGVLIEEIIALSFALRVFLLLYDEYNVSSSSLHYPRHWNCLLKEPTPACRFGKK
jgi:hypothetical protein